MPFTPAHAAAVIPLRRWFPLSALVVGSMAPDFEYFVFLPAPLRTGHTPEGVFLFCLPAGAAVLWVFHHLLREPLLSLAPEGHRRRLDSLNTPFASRPVRRLAWIAISLLVGSVSHLAWDSFSHPYGWAVHQWPLLATQVGRFPLFKILQYGSGLAGLAIVCLSYARWYGTAPHTSRHSEGKPWMLAFLLAASAAIALPAAYSAAQCEAGFSRQVFAAQTTIVFVATLSTGLLLYSVAFHLRAWRKRTGSS